MKMVKSLLLGSAAGLVAVAGAQAADLPVKAKAVEYVKICSLYGAGFYYIPGTDICMKVGGYVRFQENFANGGGNNMSNPSWTGQGGRNNRIDSQDWGMRTRAVATFDTRQQTQYGVLRTYLLMGFQQDSTVAAATSPGVYITRGFIQIAGFTFGKATSFYDAHGWAAMTYVASSFVPDTGDAGQMLAAYTAQFGSGMSASISVEQSQRLPTVFATTASYALGTAPTSNHLGQAATTASITGNPDIVANLRMDGTWGFFQIAGVLHDASGGYYGTTESTGHPSNKWGWAVSPGLRINTPMLGAGDYFAVTYTYAEGATARAIRGNNSTPLIWRGASVGFGWVEDGVYGTVAGVLTGVELTTATSISAGYEHFWTPALQTSIYGGYAKVSHNANAATLICASGIATSITMGTVAGGCNPDWSAWNIGSRTQWNVVRGLYLGVDAVYQKLKTATTAGNTFAGGTGNGAKGASVYNVEDQSAWSFAFRVHRDVVP